MEEDLQPIPLPQSIPNPDISPVRFKSLSEDAEKRKEQLEKISSAISEIKSNLDNNVQYSEYKDNYLKLNYYLNHLLPKDRVDVLKKLSENKQLDQNTFALLIGNSYKFVLDISKFPDAETKTLFTNESFKDILEILKTNKLSNVSLHPQYFDKLSTEEYLKYLFTKENSYISDFILKSESYFGISSYDLFVKYYENFDTTIHYSDSEFNPYYDDGEYRRLIDTSNILQSIVY